MRCKGQRKASPCRSSNPPRSNRANRLSPGVPGGESSTTSNPCAQKGARPRTRTRDGNGPLQPGVVENTGSIVVVVVFIRNGCGGIPAWAQALTARYGQPIASSEAQQVMEMALSKTGVSLRDIASATGLGPSTVRTILVAKKRAEDQRRRESDRLRARRYPVRKKALDLLRAIYSPSRSPRSRKRAARFVKAAKGLGR